MSAASPPPAIPVPVLDPATLARLRELDPDGRHSVVRRVLATYESSLVRQIQQLRAEATAGGGAGLAALAHTLKSSSASVGALALARACAAVEQRAREAGTAQTHDAVELIALAEEALQAVRTMLRE